MERTRNPAAAKFDGAALAPTALVTVCERVNLSAAVCALVLPHDAGRGAEVPGTAMVVVR